MLLGQDQRIGAQHDAHQHQEQEGRRQAGRDPDEPGQVDDIVDQRLRRHVKLDHSDHLLGGIEDRDVVFDRMLAFALEEDVLRLDVMDGVEQVALDHQFAAQRFGEFGIEVELPADRLAIGRPEDTPGAVVQIGVQHTLHPRHLAKDPLDLGQASLLVGIQSHRAALVGDTVRMRCRLAGLGRGVRNRPWLGKEAHAIVDPHQAVNELHVHFAGAMQHPLAHQARQQSGRGDPEDHDRGQAQDGKPAGQAKRADLRGQRADLGDHDGLNVAGRAGIPLTGRAAGSGTAPLRRRRAPSG